METRTQFFEGLEVEDKNHEQLTEGSRWAAAVKTRAKTVKRKDKRRRMSIIENPGMSECVRKISRLEVHTSSGALVEF